MTNPALLLYLGPCLLSAIVANYGKNYLSLIRGTGLKYVADPETHIKRQATRQDCLPGVLGDGGTKEVK